MGRSCMKYRSKNGFTLAELLIVVAIIAVLVAVSIPIFNGQLEKARRAVDMQNARIIKSALTNAYNEGRMDIPKKAVGQENSGCGVWVVICRSTSELPDAYTSDMLNGKSIYCGANSGVTVNGVKSNNWKSYNTGVEAVLKEAGLNCDTLKIKSRNDKEKGWDWIVIEVGFAKEQFYSRIYSGFKGDKSGMEVVAAGSSNMEKAIGGSN